ncbi:uncharacterized protein [Palaemon carinicauda]|uniref:uncharacterized protein n=1 Tax=Palaemon carinicauda TaxID=392227 RepID=UPI0035B642AC
MEMVEHRMRQLSRWQYIALFPVACLCVTTLWLLANTEFKMGFPRAIFKSVPPAQVVGEETSSAGSSPSHEKTSSQYQHPFLNQKCYIYENLRARFTCTDSTHRFINYSFDDILKCFTNLSEAIRNKSINNYWKNPGSSYRKRSAKNAVEISERPIVHLAMVGDSHIRGIFERFMRRISNDRILVEKVRMTKKEVNKYLRKSLKWVKERPNHCLEMDHLDVPLRVVFYWDKYLQRLPHLLSSWMNGSATKPTHLLLGSTLHYVVAVEDILYVKGIKVATRPFYNHLKVISPLLKTFSRSAQVVFKLQDHLERYSRYVFDDMLLLDYYNKIASDLLVPRSPSFVVWNSTIPLSDLYEKECSRNGSRLPRKNKKKCSNEMHLGIMALDRFLDMYLNDICSFENKSL